MLIEVPAACPPINGENSQVQHVSTHTYMMYVGHVGAALAPKVVKVHTMF